MKVFLSWSGPRSRAVAEALNDWLRRVIQAVKPFYSPEIEKGAKWSSEVDEALEGTRFGIICLTPDNLRSVWIHYEAGALSKTKDASIWTFLHGLTPSDVPPPLGKFQHTVSEKEDVLRLLRAINGRLADVGGEPLPERLLEENFELFWPRLEESLSKAEGHSQSTPSQTPEGIDEGPRDAREVLDEILELVRSQEQRLRGVEEYLTNEQRGGDVPNVRFTLKKYGGVIIPIKGEKEEAEAKAHRLVEAFERREPNAEASIKSDHTGHYVILRFGFIASGPWIRKFLTTVSEDTGSIIDNWTGLEY